VAVVAVAVSVVTGKGAIVRGLVDCSVGAGVGAGVFWMTPASPVRQGCPLSRMSVGSRLTPRYAARMRTTALASVGNGPIGRALIVTTVPA
jgi:hypothetical protein